jgi:hypothetical protein
LAERTRSRQIFSDHLGQAIGEPFRGSIMLHRDPGNVDAAIAVGRLPLTDPLADFFGRASYHLFIAHMPVAALLFNGLYFSPNTFLIYVATLLAALGLSGLLVPMERRINDVRRQLRAPRSARAPATKAAVTASPFPAVVRSLELEDRR